MYFNTGGDQTITDTLIRENSGASGSGIHFNLVGANTTFTNTIIRDNQASVRGGGMYITSPGSGSHPTFDKCTITGNQAPAGGGMYVQNASIPVFKNSIIADNQAVSGECPYSTRARSGCWR